MDFDILAFSETWFSPDIPTYDLLLDSFNKPEWKDRPADSHGVVMVYVKEGLHYKRIIITEPTNFTENSSSLPDIILVNNKNHVTTSGVGDPFLDQNIRYHCPVFGIFKFTKPKVQCYNRHIWQYDRGDYDHMRALASITNLHSLQDDDVDIYALNLTNKILHIA